MCLYGTGDGSFGSGDQTTHSLVVQHMVNNGDLLHPVYKGKPYYNKPPFKMWLATIPVLLLGESNFSYRVIDGLSGVGIALCLFLFARSVFASRLAGYLSVAALLGARLFFFGHGVRNAVQDSMMLLLMTLGTICGWYFVERVRDTSVPHDRRRLLRLALAGGIFIGLAALTKNVAGYMGFVVLASYLIFSGELVSVVRRSWPYLLLIGALSLAIPAAYILAQGENLRTAYTMLLYTEVFKRATKGYHFVRHNWFYWNVIVRDRSLVPPELLAGGLLFGVAAWLKQRDRRLLFLACWALIPVLVQNVMKSKLQWYVLPALPGMALLVGVFMAGLWKRARAVLREERFSAALLQPSFAFPALFFAWGLGAIGYNNYLITHDIFNAYRRNQPDEIVDDIRAFSAASGRPMRALHYNLPIIANNEIFYFNMLPQEKIAKANPEALKARLDSGEIQFVLTTAAELERIARIKPFESYAMIEARDKRRFWLAIISYVPGMLPRHFVPASQTFRLADHPEIVNNGFKRPVGIAGTVALPSSGPRSSLLVQATTPLMSFGAEAALSVASVLPTSAGKLTMHVYMNEERIATLKDIEEGFHTRTFAIPKAKWRDKTNLVMFSYELPGGAAIDANRQLVLFESITFTIKP